MRFKSLAIRLRNVAWLIKTVFAPAWRKHGILNALTNSQAKFGWNLTWSHYIFIKYNLFSKGTKSGCRVKRKKWNSSKEIRSSCSYGERHERKCKDIFLNKDKTCMHNMIRFITRLYLKINPRKITFAKFQNERFQEKPRS